MKLNILLKKDINNDLKWIYLKKIFKINLGEKFSGKETILI